MEDNESDSRNMTDTENVGSENKVKFPFLPPSMFKKYEGKGQDGKIKCWKFKCLIDDCCTKISVWPNSRCSAKRHIKASHPKQLAKYVQLLKENQRTVQNIIVTNNYDTAVELKHHKPSNQSPNRNVRTPSEFHDYILNFIVGRTMPLSSQEMPALQKMFSGEFELQTIDFYKNLLAVRYQERKNDLIASLHNAAWVSTTIDSWSSYGKYFIGNTVQWYDYNLKRHQACLGVRKLVGKLDYDSLADNLYSIYKEFNIEKKIEATVTDGGSNFIETLMLHSYLSRGDGIISEDSYEDDTDIILPSQDVTTGYNGFSVTCYKTSVFDILHQPALNNGGSNGTLSLTSLEDSFQIPTYRQCSAHLLKIMISADAEDNIEDKAYKRLLYSTNKKMTAICIKQFDSYENSYFIESCIGCLFAIIDHTQWNSYFDRMKCFSKLLTEKNEAMQSLFKALGLIWFRENEQEFIHEYVKVLQPLADAIISLNGEVSLPLSYLLPTLTILRQKLESLQHDPNIKHAKALLCSLLNSLEYRFGQMQNIPELRLAAVCDPTYKDQWLLPGEKDAYRKLLREVYDQLEMEISDEENDNSRSEEVFSTISSNSSNSKKMIKLNSSNGKKNGEEKVENEVDCFLAEPLGDSDQLLKYPLLMKIFRRYNAVSSSSAFVERLLNKVGMVFTSQPINFPEKMFDMLIFLNINSKESCSW